VRPRTLVPLDWGRRRRTVGEGRIRSRSRARRSHPWTLPPCRSLESRRVVASSAPAPADQPRGTRIGERRRAHLDRVRAGMIIATRPHRCSLPRRPTIGVSGKAARHSKTQRSADGKIPGPLTPPHRYRETLVAVRCRRRVRARCDEHQCVAPASIAARRSPRGRRVRTELDPQRQFGALRRANDLRGRERRVREDRRTALEVGTARVHFQGHDVAPRHRFGRLSELRDRGPKSTPDVAPSPFQVARSRARHAATPGPRARRR